MGCGNNVRNALSSMPVGLPPFESGYAVMTAKIVIIGGGLAGLSAGYHLADFEPVLFEKEKAIGGLCRSFTQDGFTFDCTGHLFFQAEDGIRDLTVTGVQTCALPI